MDEKKDATPEIKVVDKRHFNPDGSEKEGPREEVPPDPELSSPSFGETAESNSALNDVNFANLILSLAGSAQMSLGIAPNPFTQKVEKHLPQAKQTIDLLGMLEEKTRGNLSPEEASLMKVVLSDLRLRYVEEKNKP